MYVNLIEADSIQIKDSAGTIRKATIVNEPGVYTLMFHRKPKKTRSKGGAESKSDLNERAHKMVELRRWVGDTVFPAILTFPEKLREYADVLEWREGSEKMLMAAEKQRAVAAPKRRSSVHCH